MEIPNNHMTPPKADLSQIPRDLHCWLIFPCNYYDNSTENENENGEEVPKGFLGFVNLSDPDREVHKLRLTEATGRLVCGSSAGWLVTLRSGGDIHLLQPFTRAHIQLPQLTFDAFPDVPSTFEGSMRRVYIDKVIVGFSYSSNAAPASSSSSFETDGVVMALCFKPKKLAFYRVGKDQNWASFEGFSGKYKDIAFYKNRFYAIRNRSHIFVASGLDGPSATMEDLMEILNYGGLSKYYLVESSGDLLLVVRHLGSQRRQTLYFSVFKLDVDGGNMERLESIGNHCLFLDCNTAISLSASDVPGCKGNHIYFIGTCFAGYSMQSFGRYDMGVFDIEDGNFEPFNYCNDRNLVMHPPIWYPTCYP
ncbi:uncharacterized protein LOC122659089 [Telopea speciosissima]|uniref:uncharacterized protein LOC122659089 n=1 Tax=Telopea speciosissima TaxID=54955 RepID=UPI001CC7F65B|nr:uncharacterized protein LOC122659089 [Telopea speciosissima]